MEKSKVKKNKPDVINYPGKGLAWADFLHHRLRVLKKWEAEGKPLEYMQEHMSMDLIQIRFLLMENK